MAKLRVSMSPEMAQEWGRLAAEAGLTPARWLELAVALYSVCHQGKRRGKRIGLAADPSVFETHIVGIP